MYIIMFENECFKFGALCSLLSTLYSLIFKNFNPSFKCVWVKYIYVLDTLPLSKSSQWSFRTVFTFLVVCLVCWFNLLDAGPLRVWSLLLRWNYTVHLNSQTSILFTRLFPPFVFSFIEPFVCSFFRCCHVKDYVQLSLLWLSCKSKGA